MKTKISIIFCHIFWVTTLLLTFFLDFSPEIQQFLLIFNRLRTFFHELSTFLAFDFLLFHECELSD